MSEGVDIMLSKAANGLGHGTSIGRGISKRVLFIGLIAGGTVVASSMAVSANDTPSQSDWETFLSGTGTESRASQQAAPSPRRDATPYNPSAPATDADMEAFLNGETQTGNGDLSAPAGLAANQDDARDMAAIPFTSDDCGQDGSIFDRRNIPNTATNCGYGEGDSDDEADANVSRELTRTGNTQGQTTAGTNPTPQDPVDLTANLPGRKPSQAVAGIAVSDPATLAEFGTGNAPDSIAQINVGTAAEDSKTDGDALVELDVLRDMVADENGDPSGVSISIGEALDGDEPGDGTAGPLSDNGALNIVMNGVPAGPGDIKEPDDLALIQIGPNTQDPNGFIPVTISLEQGSAPEQEIAVPVSPGGDSGPSNPGGERTVIATADTTIDFIGRGDSDFDGDNDQADLLRNAQTGLTIAAAELTNANPESHVLAQTITDLSGGGDDLQQDVSDLLVGDPSTRNNDLATDVQNIVEGLTTPETGGNSPPPGTGERTVVATVDTAVDIIGRGDSDFDGDNDQADLQRNIETGLAIAVLELTNTNPESHVIAQTVTDLTGGGDDLQQDIGDLLVGDAATFNNDLATDVQNIAEGLTTPESDGTAPPPGTGERTIVATVDTAVDTIGAGDTDADNDNDQADLARNVQAGLVGAIGELTNTDPSSHVIAQTVADLTGGGDDLQEDVSDLIIGNDERGNRGLAKGLENVVTGLVTPGNGFGNGGLPVGPNGIDVGPASPFGPLAALDQNGDDLLSPSDLPSDPSALPLPVGMEGLNIGEAPLDSLAPFDQNGDTFLSPADLVTAIGPTGSPLDDVLTQLP